MKIHFVTLRRLNRALARVRGELLKLGAWDDPLAEVDVTLVPVGAAYGWQHYGGSGAIHIPAISTSKIRDFYLGSYTSLADVLRHEYGHAVADTHRGLIRSRRFRGAFGTSHDDPQPFEHAETFHLSPYAATNAMEDFAETFMTYVRHGGQLPLARRTPAIRAKWRFVRDVCRAVASGQRTW